MSLGLDEAQGPGQCVLGIWQCLAPFLYEPLARDQQGLGVFWNQYVWSLLYLKQVCISPDGPLWSCVMGPLQRGEPRPLRLGGMRVPLLDLLPKAGASGSIWSPFGTSEWAYVWLSAASGAEQPG